MFNFSRFPSMIVAAWLLIKSLMARSTLSGLVATADAASGRRCECRVGSGVGAFNTQADYAVSDVLPASFEGISTTSRNLVQPPAPANIISMGRGKISSTHLGGSVHHERVPRSRLGREAIPFTHLTRHSIRSTLLPDLLMAAHLRVAGWVSDARTVAAWAYAAVRQIDVMF